ncbi:MAG: hypothetical protein A2X86_05920 [Bdellovibrionales bacterium GWA2_49_15]|nr:MAG: hypothetical protein A2X86_05920 [Bdellovibrionales bacterium GWA2_49_15]
MDLVKTGINLSKAIRNVGRLKEIVTVFARNGFDEFINLGILSKIPNFVLPRADSSIKDEADKIGDGGWSKIVGVRLRKCFEELGPTFIKFGQLLSSREDIFEPAFIDEMKQLRDRVKEVSFVEVRSDVEQALGVSIDKIFKNIDERPIGTASIGIAYRAILLDGTEVVLKVRRPNIKKIVQTDFSIMIFLASQLEKASAEIKYLGLARILRDFGVTLNGELNFQVEAVNCKKFSELLIKLDEKKTFYVPSIYGQYTTERTIVMEFLKGIPFSDATRIKPHLPIIQEKLTHGLQIFILSILQEGFFHADLHGGNFFLLENNQIGIIDYGMMGHLGRKSRQNFLAILYALITFNFENLVYEFLDVSEFDQIPDIEKLIADVRESLTPYVGLTVQQTNYSELFQIIISTLSKHRLYLPRDWFIVFRALITLDGVGRSLNLDFDLFGMIESDIRDIIKEGLDKDVVMEEAIWSLRDILPIMRVLPRHLKWFIKDFAKNKYALEIKQTGYQAELRSISDALIFLAYCFITGIFIAAGFLFVFSANAKTFNEVPNLAWLVWAVGIIVFIRGRVTLKS